MAHLCNEHLSLIENFDKRGLTAAEIFDKAYTNRGINAMDAYNMIVAIFKFEQESEVDEMFDELLSMDGYDHINRHEEKSGKERAAAIIREMIV
jgi:hypothetical protein